MKESTKTGIGSMQATTLFRITNFELFAKPNKYVMGAGLLAVTGCVSYIAYMNIREKNKQMVPENVSVDNTTQTTRHALSKWD